MNDEVSTPKQTALSVTFNNRNDLYMAYMPYLKNGGLFIHSNKEFCMGQPIFLVLTLPDDPEKIPVEGLVVWITPVGAQGGLPAGIGIEFSSNTELLRSKIETLLVGLSAERRTDAM